MKIINSNREEGIQNNNIIYQYHRIYIYSTRDDKNYKKIHNITRAVKFELSKSMENMHQPKLNSIPIPPGKLPNYTPLKNGVPEKVGALTLCGLKVVSATAHRKKGG